MLIGEVVHEFVAGGELVKTELADVHLRRHPRSYADRGCRAGMADESTSVGTYFNRRDIRNVLEPFDERFEKRSQAIKNAMRMYVYIDEALEDQDLEFANERDKRIWVRQAINNELTRQGESIEQLR